MRVGIAHHLGWAVAVSASADYQVVDRRRIELIEPGMATAPIHHEGKPLDAATAEPIISISLRAWPFDFPDDIAVQRRAPYESHAHSMYRQILAEVARTRGWGVQLFDAKTVEDQAASILGERADEVLYEPRKLLGPPWAKDHRMALAATIVAAACRPFQGRK